jgi:hypothetical protein
MRLRARTARRLDGFIDDGWGSMFASMCCFLGQIGPRKDSRPHEARVPPLGEIAPFPGARAGHGSRKVE